MTLLLIRHAESVANAGFPTVHTWTIPLTTEGHRQAKELADNFLTPPDAIIVSATNSKASIDSDL